MRGKFVLAFVTFSVLGLLATAQVRQTPYYAPPADNRSPTATNDPYPMPAELVGVELLKQTAGEAHAKSAGCIACHQNVGDPHGKDTFRLGCTDCHGGDANSSEKHTAHVASRFPGAWPTAGNPERTWTLLNHESPDYIRFVNPGDLRVAHLSCGTVGCHPKEVHTNRKQIMTSGAMLWGAALYNNGSVPYKRAQHGEFYAMDGTPLRAQTVPAPTAEELKKGVVPYLDPLPRFEMSQPGNILRIFERGGRFRGAEVGLPEKGEEPGRPRARISDRGLGTVNRTDPVLVSLNKTRLFDTLNFLGTNDHPGDYRSSGCSACHVVYANDRSSVHSGPYARHGNGGLAAMNADPTICKTEPGHPIDHKFTSAIPTSQCMVCHIHPGTTVMNSYCGYMWWDEETEGKYMYPEKDKKLSAQQFVQVQMRNPDEAAARGNWSDPQFLAKLTDLNGKMDKAQFADFHSHGWVFRAVFKHDKQGRLVDHRDKPVGPVTPELLQAAVKVPERAKELYRDVEDVRKLLAAEEEFKKSRDGLPVHMMDIHLEKGMHCVDCHFVQDMHGNGRLHMEVRAACEIQCIDCHGTAKERANLKTSGPASYTSSAEGGRDLRQMRTPFGKPRFEVVGDKVYQNSMVERGVRWEVKQVRDTIDPKHSHYNEKSRLAKTVRFEGGQLAWGDTPGNCDYAHDNSNMHCVACHSSWNPSCYGCHLPQKANTKMPHLHWDGDVTRNYTSYCFQTLRDDVYMLARDGDATGNRIGPARSSCAIHVGSYNQNRESIYVQQQTVSAEGFSGLAFSTNVPHTVRGAGRYETKQCTDCHVSIRNDNNAWMAQLLMHGTNNLNFIGRYAWVATGEHGLAAVEVTEREEPQAVIGSSLHKLAFPGKYAEHQKHHAQLKHAHEHPGPDIARELVHPLKKHEVLQVQNRGEYLYAACGEAGVRVYDIAFIDDKAFAERITTAPVSPMGQKFYAKTKHAMAVAAPCTHAPDPTRTHLPENKEQKVHGLFGYLYVADKCEGLILIGAAPAIDGDPANNFLKREVTFNPDGVLDGANNVIIVGHYAYVTCEAGLVVVDIDDPKNPKVTHLVGKEFLKHAKGVQVQFRYAYAWDEEGIKVLDVSDLAHPRPAAVMRLPHVHSVYLARTYAYVAAGPRGLVILDITVPDRPKIDQTYNADGLINDCHDVKLGITYVSQFAYLADGKNGLRVVQLTSPDTPGNDGFSTRPTPKLVATYKIPHEGHALAVAKGLDRDRAVDESGNQIAVFGRVGARPLNKAEQRKLYLRDGKVWGVTDDPRDREVYPEPREFRKESSDKR